MMEGAGSSANFVHVYHCTRHCLPGDIILINIDFPYGINFTKRVKYAVLPKLTIKWLSSGTKYHLISSLY